ncbi:MAG TPA: polysaccharide deacetylase family protein [Planctomycetota bacterium]|nr:polysaccharide deacetylase family protein [Planctomycetota bacterium]
MSLFTDASWIYWQLIQRSQMLRGSLAILTYHRVCARGDHGFLQDGGVPFVTPEVFAAQVARLAGAGFEVVQLEQALQRRALGERFARRTIAITFDDGYLDNLEAARVLHRAGLPATLFVATDCLARTELLCEHRLFLALDRLGADATRELLADLVPARWRRRFVEHVLLRLPGAQRDFAHERLGRALHAAGVDEPALCRELYLGPEHLEQLRALGVAIGSHGARHHPWTTLSEPEKEADLARADSTLRATLGDAVAPLFASPYGSHRARDRRLLAGRGFRGALSTRFGSNGRGTDPLLLRRIAIGDGSAHRLAFLERSARLAGVFDGL